MRPVTSPTKTAAPAQIFSAAVLPVLEDAPIVITICEATRLLCVGRSTIYKLLGERALTLIKIGNCSRILRSSLEAYVRQAAI